MRLARLNHLAAFVAVVGAVACGGKDGGTAPCTPGPATQLEVSGNNQTWYNSNPLPNPYKVTARDANNCAVPGIVVTWTITTGGGGLSPAQSTTNSSGVATTVDSVGTASAQVVRATAAGSVTQDFTANAVPPPTATTADVSVADNSFSPTSVGIKSGGTVTWTFTGSNVHNVTFVGGPTGPGTIPDRNSGTANRTFTTLGRYSYVCTNHAGMSGTVDVVH